MSQKWVCGETLGPLCVAVTTTELCLGRGHLVGSTGGFSRGDEDHLLLKYICLQSPELGLHSLIWSPLYLPHAKLMSVPGKWGPLHCLSAPKIYYSLAPPVTNQDYLGSGPAHCCSFLGRIPGMFLVTS